jgi:hypothetical protein
VKLHLGGDKAWDAMGTAVRQTSGRVYAAVGYLGKDAPSVLPLKSGDVLVCDASDAAVKSGGTHPDALDLYLRRAVVVYSYAGLHAKVIILPKRVFIGSANASLHSRMLEEAMLETTDEGIRRELRQWIGQLSIVELDRAQVAALRPLVPKRRAPMPHKIVPPAALPDPLSQLTIDTTVGPTFWTRASERAYTDQVSGVNRRRRNTARDSRLNVVEWPRWHLQRLHEGTWLVYVWENDWAQAPAQVIHRSYTSKNHGLLWLARPPVTNSRVRWSQVRRTLEKQSHDPTKATLRLSAQDAEDIAALFR